jgi:hypothetical protein
MGSALIAHSAAAKTIIWRRQAKTLARKISQSSGCSSLNRTAVSTDANHDIPHYALMAHANDSTSPAGYMKRNMTASFVPPLRRFRNVRDGNDVAIYSGIGEGRDGLAGPSG